MSTLTYIEVIETLRLASCPPCGMIHAMPLAVFEGARRDQTPIHCPRGHAWVPLAHDADPASNVEQRRIEAYAALADTRLKLEAAQARLLEVGAADPGPITAKELRRRANIIAGRAQRATGGGRYDGPQKFICPFCGGKQSEGYFPKHLRRRHTPEMASKPAAYFDQAADRILSRFQ